MRYYPPRYLFRRHEILRRVKPANSLLEIGAGNLYLTADLISKFAHGTVVDFNPEIQALFDELPHRVRSKLDFVTGDFLDVELSEVYNCVVACEVLEHVAEEGQFLERVRASLTSGGQLILSVPARMRLWSVHDEIVGHLRRYEKDELVNLIEDHQFKNVEIVSYGYPFVNLARIPRVAGARRVTQERSAWNQLKQTQKSGLAGMSSSASKLMGLFVNPTTAYPLCKFASLFNRFNLSNGYIVIAETDA